MSHPASDLDAARQKREESLKEFERRLEQIIDSYATNNGLSKDKALSAAANTIGKLTVKYGG